MHKCAPARKTVTLPTPNTTSKSAEGASTFQKFPFLHAEERCLCLVPVFGVHHESGNSQLRQLGTFALH